MKVTAGWMPATGSGAERVSEADDLDWIGILMRQIDLVTDYLAQAQSAHRSSEEILGLAQNLAELESELEHARI